MPRQQLDLSRYFPAGIFVTSAFFRCLISGIGPASGSAERAGFQSEGHRDERNEQQRICHCLQCAAGGTAGGTRTGSDRRHPERRPLRLRGQGGCGRGRGAWASRDGGQGLGQHGERRGGAGRARRWSAPRGRPWWRLWARSSPRRPAPSCSPRWATRSSSCAARMAPSMARTGHMRRRGSRSGSPMRIASRWRW